MKRNWWMVFDYVFAALALALAIQYGMLVALGVLIETDESLAGYVLRGAFALALCWFFVRSAQRCKTKERGQ
jgi:hypothetical protein